MPRVSQTAVKLYHETVSYFMQLLVNTSNIVQASPQWVVEALAIKLLEDVPSPWIDEIEWNFEHWPFREATNEEAAA